MSLLTRFRYPIGFLVAFVVWSLVGASLPLSLGWVLIVVTFLSGLAAGVLTVKLLKP